MTQRFEDSYTPAEVAEREGVHEKTIQKWIREGKIPANRSPGGRLWQIPLDYREQLRSTLTA